MTHEDKELLLEDLCGRLPHGVIIHHKDFFDPKYPRPNETLTIGNLAQYMKDIERWDVKPYLRPMSSMTEEEEKEYINIDNRSYFCPMAYAHIPASNRIDWLNAHHFDYRNLIGKGLALKAPEGMYEN